MIEFCIEPDDLTGEDVLDLLRLHLDEMHSWSPSCKVHAMPPERLREPDVTFFTVRDGEILAGVGALKALGSTRGELKSMRASPTYRGQGVGKLLLRHLIDEARARGYTWLGLETGRPEPFLPAVRLYEAHGFAECAAFGDYVSDEFSLCMEKHLE
uniref:GNAT family N-acetyltransferase n=1 Tax=uncultured Erythrobacter sp. TaxID=263913 RepID=UPI0026017AE6|nr:GNAT family N-acetyltransferase [uncultured Erythrobacter sp.]